MRPLLLCGLYGFLLAALLLAGVYVSGFPSWAGGLFMLLGLPGYMTAAILTAGARDINSRGVLFCFCLIYVVVNGSVFTLIMVAAQKVHATLRRKG